MRTAFGSCLTQFSWLDFVARSEFISFELPRWIGGVASPPGSSVLAITLSEYKYCREFNYAILVARYVTSKPSEGKIAC